MNSLFLRIFLCFWLAMGLLVTSAVAIMSSAEETRSQALASINPATLSDEASLIARTQGVEKLRDWIQSVERIYPMLAIYIVDRRNEDILARTLSEVAEDRIKAYRNRAFRRYVEVAPAAGHPEDEAVDREAHRKSWWNIRRLQLPDGTKLEMIFDPLFYAPLGTFDIPHSPWFLLLFGFVVSGLACWGLARYLVLPVRQLQQDVRRLANIDLETQSASRISRRRDEIGVLARDVDSMATRIRELLEMKETLLRDVSHELRSPLARLQVALSLARRGGERLPVQLDRIQRECLFLEEMTSRILEAASVKASNAEPVDEVVMDTIVDEVVQDAQFEANDKHVEVRVAHAASPISLRGDASALHSAIENVLRNALRFSPSGSRVLVSIKRDDGHARIDIADSGPGVPEPQLGRIFEPFFRVAEARDRNSGGTGLGLAIVAAIVERHRGTIVASNRTDGPGLLVSIGLPALD